MRAQTVIDVGTSSRPVPAPGGRKLKKTCTGRGSGPPVSPSAASAAGENWSTMSHIQTSKCSVPQLDVWWRPSSSASTSTALSGHTIEKIGLVRGAYLERTDPLSSLHF